MQIPEAVFHHGQPFFIYSESEIEASIQSARNFWAQWSLPGFEIYFSVKVNPNPHLLRIVAQHVDGFDVSSLAEAQLLERLSWSPQKMTWSGPAKTDRALAFILKSKLRCIHLDSTDEWLEIQKTKPLQQPACSVRISTSDLHSQKLGFSDIELTKLMGHTRQAFSAVHTYLGRETFTQAAMTGFRQRLQAKIQSGYLKADAEIFLGAGLPSRLILQSSLKDLAPQEKPDRILHLESGRGLIQSSGWYGTQILSLKESKAKQNVIIDGGLQHLATHFLSPRFKDQEVIVRFFRDGKELLDRSTHIALHGSLSLWHDTMIEDVRAPVGLRRGDWIVANHQGAYGYSAASNQFLGPTPIREWLVNSSNQLLDISAQSLTPYQRALR